MSRPHTQSILTSRPTSQTSSPQPRSQYSSQSQSQRQRQHPASSGSQTITTAPTPPPGFPAGTLRLRGASPPPQPARPRVRWAEDVVNNEGMGRKSSKVCCIYHKPREVGESSSEDDSSSSSSSSDEDSSEDERDYRRGRAQRRRGDDGLGHGHGHEHGEDCAHGNGSEAGGRRPSPNAYEKMPKPKLRGKGGSVTQTVER